MKHCGKGVRPRKQAIKDRLGTPHFAILLPRKPDAELLKWLAGLKISVIWKQRKAFVDNANGKFI